MYRRFVQRIAVLFLTLGLLAPAAPQPALAARGGGCSTNDAKISSCISYSRGNVIGDFYMNAYYDRSVYYAYIQIRTTNTGNSRWYGPYTLNRNGRFGPVSKGVTTLPPSSGCAFTRVHLYTSNWTYHYYRDSPRVCYP